MVAPGTRAPGTVVVVPFPFSDLSQSKPRPAVALAGAGRGDWILCQITSNPYSDPDAVELPATSFRREAVVQIIEAVIRLLRDAP